MTAIELLQGQHREVEQLMGKVPTSQGAQKISLLGQIAEKLTLHARLEEQHLYPVLRRNGMEDQVSHSLEEHAQMRKLVSEILELKRSDPRLEKAIGQLESVVRDHVQEEESELFPKAREKLDAATLERAGEEMKRAMGALENEELIAQADEQPTAP